MPATKPGRSNSVGATQATSAANPSADARHNAVEAWQTMQRDRLESVLTISQITLD